MDPQEVARVAQKHGIRLLLQFGSSVTGRLQPDSDLDLAVRLERAPDTLDEEVDLMTDLQGLAAGRTADVTLINRADPLLLKQIVEHGRLLYGTRRNFDAFRLYAFKRYQDHRRYLGLERDYVDRDRPNRSMTIDRELVTRKLLLITADLDPLRQIHNRGAGAFLASTLDQAVVERLLDRAITRMIDVN